MGALRYSVITSLDGYTSDAGGGFDWSAPDEEVHAFVNDLERPVGTYLYGRRMYDTMRYWQDPPGLDSESGVIRDYAEIWQGADKVVFSRTLAEPLTPRTHVERDFAAGTVQALKDASEADLSIGGAELGRQALALGLVDEVQQLISPVVVGGGNAFLPAGLRLDLELLEDRRFGNGVVLLRYRVLR